MCSRNAVGPHRVDLRLHPCDRLVVNARGGGGGVAAVAVAVSVRGGGVGGAARLTRQPSPREEARTGPQMTNSRGGARNCHSGEGLVNAAVAADGGARSRYCSSCRRSEECDHPCHCSLTTSPTLSLMHHHTTPRGIHRASPNWRTCLTRTTTQRKARGSARAILNSVHGDHFYLHHMTKTIIYKQPPLAQKGVVDDEHNAPVAKLDMVRKLALNASNVSSGSVARF